MTELLEDHGAVLLPLPFFFPFQRENVPAATTAPSAIFAPGIT